MKITFVLPFAGLNGGVRVVATYARILHERGHEVTVVSQPFKKHVSVRKGLLQILRRKTTSIPIATKLLEPLGKNHIIWDRNDKVSFLEQFPDADIIVATWWETAEWICDIPKNKGEKVYLLQDYEVFPHLPYDRVTSTYKLPFRKIAVSSYISETLKVIHNVNDVDIIPNSVDGNLFGRRPRLKGKSLKVGFLYSPAERKNIKLAVSALIKLKSLHPDVSAFVFGNSDISTDMALPEWVIYKKAPPENEIPLIYAQCDVWLFTSHSEGFGLPILEAMACGTPVIATEAGAAPDIINGRNGSIVDKNTQSFVKELNRYYDMGNDEWEQISSEATMTAHSYSWNDATNRLLLCFEKYIKESAISFSDSGDGG